MTARTRGMRIAELVKRSGTTKETIHFYLREGLLKRPKKTSKNMAYYDEAHLEQLELIKKLRTESYLPLHVIKKVLKQGKLGASARQIDLAGALFGEGARAELEPLTRAELAERTGLSEARIEAYETKGLLRPSRVGRIKRYGYEDVRVAETAAAAEREAGEGGEALVLERLEIIERHVHALVRDEVAHFFGRVLVDGDSKRALELLRGGRETVGRFLALSRARRLREEVEAMLPQVERTLQAQPHEPFFFHLEPAAREARAEPERRTKLLEVCARKPQDASALCEALQHLVLLGDADEAIARYERARGKARDDRVVLALYAEALVLAERFEDVLRLLERLRDDLEAPDPWLEALWGTSALIRARDSFNQLDSSTELIGLLARAFSAFDHARKAEDADRFTRARILGLLGRICVATPEFLGVRGQGREDLEAALVLVDELSGELEAGRVPGSLGEALAAGGLARLELNTLYFLAKVTQDEPARVALLARFDALRGA